MSVTARAVALLLVAAIAIACSRDTSAGASDAALAGDASVARDAAVPSDSGACGDGAVGCALDGGVSCVDVASDPRACGGCGVACCAGNLCEQGRCIVGCPQGETACPVAGDMGCSGAFCVDVTRDSANCGACGHACATGGPACVNGACQ